MARSTGRWGAMVVLVVAIGLGVGPGAAASAQEPSDAGPASGYARCERARDGGAPLGPGPVVPEGSVAVLPPTNVVVDGPGEAITGYRIGLDVTASGDVAVRESIDYHFGAEQRHGIFRTIDDRQRCDDVYDRVYPVGGVAASSPTGAPAQVQLDQLDGGVALKVGDPDVLVSGNHSYDLGYDIGSVMTPHDDRVELYWNVVGDGWPLVLAQIDVVVRGPAEPLRIDCFVGAAGSTQRCDALAVAGVDATFGQGVLGPNQGMTVVVAYPPGAFDLRGPVLEERWSLERAFSADPAVLGATAMLLVLGLGGISLLAWRTGRDHQLAGSHVDAAFAPAGASGTPVPLRDATTRPVEVAPPDRLRPAQVAVIVHERVTGRDVSATIVDLAVRGYLRIVEEGEGRDTEYRLDWLGDGRIELLDYERQLTGALFAGGTSVALSDLDETFAASQRRVISAVYDDAVARGWFPARPDQVRRRWAGRGVLALLVSSGVLAAAVAFTTMALVAVPLVLASVLLLVLAGRMPRRTPAGTGLLRRSIGFRDFIEDSEAPRAVWAEQRSIFTDYLPYAIVFRAADRWARTFEPLGDEALEADLVWYHGTAPFSVARLADAAGSFTDVATSTLSSSPASSGGSGFDGGSSGGGGGGGGGGSW